MTYLSVSSIATAISAYATFKIVRFFYRRIFSPLRHLPGPPRPTLLIGNEKELWDTESYPIHEQWIERYGPTMCVPGFFGVNHLYTTDLKALNHVMMNSNIYQKPDFFRYYLSEVVGQGLLVVEGDTHKNHRRVMNPAFGAAQIRELTDVFVEKSIEMRDAWSADISKQQDGSIDVLSWLSKMTLDVIGQAGFNYQFNSLADGEGKNELNHAFSTIFSSNMEFSFITFLRLGFPSLRWIPEWKDDGSKQARATMDKVGRELLDKSKENLQTSGGKVEKSSERLKSRDILTLLLKANMATDIPEHQRMNDDEVLAQIPTFLAAGHETTSTSTTWALYALSENPQIQRKLRDELSTISTDNPTMDELNSLPYLDHVVREVLRLYPPVPFTERLTAKEDVLPLSTSVTDRNGDVRESLHIPKGEFVLIPILSVNRDKKIWGEDSLQFRPERWESPPEAASGIPGIWGNMLTFIGGPRACIGYRFSLVEMKALLFTLIRAFEFELPVPAEEIGISSWIVQRPFLKSDPKAGTQLPLKVKPVLRT
ncbi:hypothetical protein MD484_g7214, partial [Candolleomyces efflorescens]